MLPPHPTSELLILEVNPMTPADSRVTLVGPERLAALVVDAGLAAWLIEKASSRAGGYLTWRSRADPLTPALESE